MFKVEIWDDKEKYHVEAILNKALSIVLEYFKEDLISELTEMDISLRFQR